MIDFSNKTVLITGGTQGAGRAIALEFARLGATTVLTYKWGTADEEALRADFEAAGGPRPILLRADVGEAADSRAVIEHIAGLGQGLHAIISNVAFGPPVHSVDALDRRDLERAIRYSAWPVVDLLQASADVLGGYPRYLLGISSNGGDVCLPGYDYVGAAKAVMETLGRYLALRLRSKGVRINMLRPGYFETHSMEQIFGPKRIARFRERGQGLAMDPAGVGKACVAFCSGLLDSVTGQVINVDEGWSLASPVQLLMHDPQEGPLVPFDAGEAAAPAGGSIPRSHPKGE